MSRSLSVSQLATLRVIKSATNGLDAWVVNREAGATVPSLVRHGYLESKSEPGLGGRVLTWVRLTEAGRKAAGGAP